jgi:hypothetical protein
MATACDAFVWCALVRPTMGLSLRSPWPKIHIAPHNHATNRARSKMSREGAHRCREKKYQLVFTRRWAGGSRKGRLIGITWVSSFKSVRRWCACVRVCVCFCVGFRKAISPVVGTNPRFFETHDFFCFFFFRPKNVDVGRYCPFSSATLRSPLAPISLGCAEVLLVYAHPMSPNHQQHREVFCVHFWGVP